MDTSNPARLYALVFGAVLLAAGIIGFFSNTDFSLGDNALHLTIGAVGVIAGLASRARTTTPASTSRAS